MKSSGRETEGWTLAAATEWGGAMAAGAWYGAGGMESIELNSKRAGGSFGMLEITQQRGAEALLTGGVLGQQECAG